jgi:xylulokinase
MADALVLAVDCSTTAVKAIVFDTAGRSVAGARRPLLMSRPHPGFHEQDAEQWWTATVGAMVEVIASLEHAEDLRAISITHQRESFACLDRDGRPTRPAILWVDTRAAAQIAEFGSPRVASVSGKPPDVTPAIYKMAWLRQHEPATLRDAAQVGDVQAFLVERLTGRWATSHGSADALGLFDLAELTWDDELLAIAGVRRDQLPELVPSGELLDLLTTEMARELGLPAPIPLVAGTGDGQAAGLGADAGGSSVAYLNLGTSMVMGAASDRYLTDVAFRTLAGPRDGTFVLETLLNSAGYLVEWFRDQFGLFPDDQALDEAVAGVPPGSDGLRTLPYWNAVQPPHWDPLARGATVGWHGGHTPAHFLRSMLEGVAYEADLHLAGLVRATGTPISSLHAVGGGTRSRVWVQIMADVTGRTVHVETEGEVSAKGAAVLAHAYLAYGGNAGIPSAVADLAGTQAAVEPDPSAAETYRGLAGVHHELYGRLQPIFRRLATSSPRGTRS